ncbi:MAG: alpha/beta hydrolase [Pseudomonadota bacterium]
MCHYVGRHALAWLPKLIVASALLLAAATGHAESTEQLAFDVAGNRLVGFLERPTQRPASSTIIIVHSAGETNVVEWNSYARERALFTGLGINVVVWDKPGNGESEGTFDMNQPVGSSAEEVVAAVHKLRTLDIPGSQRIGLWGGSRAGWIAPLAIQAEPSIAFWISISGVDDKENARYLLQSNLPIEGRSAEETERLVSAWQRSVDIAATGGSYADYAEAAAELSDDPFLQFMGWDKPIEEDSFRIYQSQFETGAYRYDPQARLAVYVQEFPELLASLDIPVLALFGELDTNVDWRKTRALYLKTIGANPHAELEIRSFPGANHMLRQARTGGVREQNTESWNWPYAEGYFEIMTDWLVARKFGRRPNN